ncbi:alanyl-tRNA synthetase [Acidothermus cellulolyticus 11B]|uniref:Alanine--tRNA ligase n=1 Tax=Acidothermus cellulolyticus (strain ATCC 43068 / DSM 8971 / 11B) TaxID=351607 RepID=SYA_ACIC1|nr:alanine--tRNA ligase [Acidothermus cellulolyticus]A0LUJ2.1 RecName: Full=Alanine--tRNA ligase; AltName: Full=Alanyl-tRNA synthetase; Short=AlaRS [Acidothermus cellulolyticus 11B]ABK53102.1 alanyl-tRNA synthetase [Acidothermus cellulolyticus 11B]
MESAEIARRWLAFFEKRDHVVVPSTPLVADDPELLFVVAGMQPFKPYFRGDAPAPWPRATSVQKVLRTPDIDEVGKTTRHATFFHMCGNFSFGDYFKETAIPLAWELLTTPVADGGYGFAPDRLWVTVYTDDDEAADIWHRVVGLPVDRIQRRGMADNFWSMGVPGPCGPCSEIYYDRGPEFGVGGGPVANEERYLEVWNLVFMQYERGPGGAKDNYPILGELPAKNIDTGMGLERMAAILQGVDNIYEIDTTRPILDKAAELTGQRYGSGGQNDVRLRMVADHIRAITMLVNDGVVPSNEERGYVLRRLMRRVVRAMRLLGAREPTMHELVATAIAVFTPQYPELSRNAERIFAVADGEEASFFSTLAAGTARFEAAVREAGGGVLSGEQAFVLHDTYGFPIDLTLEMAAEQGVTVDEEGFRALMAEQRRRAKEDAERRKTGAADRAAYRAAAELLGRPVEFTGYTERSGEAVVRGLLVDGAAVPAAHAGQRVEVVLDRTPFYAEGGGQLPDHGVLEFAAGRIDVDDVQQPLPGLIVHRGRVADGEITVGETVLARIDVDRRWAISRSHTATHMVHKAFREFLGDTAAQAGSENAPGRFRFDFTNPSAVPPSVLGEVEERVNDLLLHDLEVTAQIMRQQEAIASGAIAMFGEKYGDQVRVISIGDWSRELCGGTHVPHTGHLGVIKIVSESSIGAGVRRIEALVGLDAYRYLAREAVLVSQLAEQLKAPADELPDRIAGMLARLRDAEKELEKLRQARLLAEAPRLAAARVDVGGLAVVAARVDGDGVDADGLRLLATDLRQRLGGSAVVVLAGVAGGRPVVVAAVGSEALARGVKAGELVGVAAKRLGGGGGGRPDFAQGGGTNPAAVDDAVSAALDAVRAQVG